MNILKIQSQSLFLYIYSERNFSQFPAVWLQQTCAGRFGIGLKCQPLFASFPRELGNEPKSGWDEIRQMTLCSQSESSEAVHKPVNTRRIHKWEGEAKRKHNWNRLMLFQRVRKNANLYKENKDEKILAKWNFVLFNVWKFQVHAGSTKQEPNKHYDWW